MSWRRSFGAMAMCLALTPMAFSQSDSQDKALEEIKKELAQLRKENDSLQHRLAQLESSPAKGSQDLEREILQLNARFAAEANPGAWDGGQGGGMKKAGPTWSWSGALRERIEWRSDTTGTDNFLVLSRFDVGLDVVLSDSLKLYAQMRDSRIFGDALETETVPGNNPNGATQLTTDDSSPEFHQVYAWMKDFMGTGMDMKFGRQEAVYGAQRLIGNDDWSNVARSFEGFRMDGSCGDLGYSLFLYLINTTDQGAKTSTYEDERLYGLYTTYPFDPELMNLDIYALLYDNDSTSINMQTYGIRSRGNFDMFDYEFEYAAQQNPGSDAGPEMEFSDAYMVHANIGLTIGDMDGKPRLGFAHDTGSFDTSTGKGWTDLFPSNHGRFGESDFFTSVANLVHNAVTLDMEIMDGWMMGTSFHWQDAFEQAGSNRIGREANLTLNGKCGDHVWVKISGGRQWGDSNGTSTYGVAAPWTTPAAGISSTDATFAFVQFTVPF